MFAHAKFNAGTIFENATFAHAEFDGAVFEAPVGFNNASFDSGVFSDSRFNLKPHWFINSNPREFEFVDVVWSGSFGEDIKAIEARPIPNPNLLPIAYRHLALNAEENHRYEEASHFRYRSMDLPRRQHAHGLAIWTLRWWHWVLSGYGERVFRAFMVLLIIWMFFASAYTHVSFIQASGNKIVISDSKRSKSESRRNGLALLCKVLA